MEELNEEEWAVLMELIKNPPAVPQWLVDAVRGDAAEDEVS